MGKQGNRCQQSHIREIWTNTHKHTHWHVCMCVHAHKHTHASLRTWACAYTCKENAITHILIEIQIMFLPLLMRHSKGYINCCFPTLFLWTQHMNMHPLSANLGNQHIPTNHASLILKMAVGIPHVPSSLEDETLKIHATKTWAPLTALHPPQCKHIL